MVMGTTRAKAARPDVGHQLGQHLLGAVGRRRDAVGGQHPQGDRPAEALRAQLLGDQRRPQQRVLQPVAERLGEVHPPATLAGPGGARRCGRGGDGPRSGGSAGAGSSPAQTAGAQRVVVGAPLVHGAHGPRPKAGPRPVGRPGPALQARAGRVALAGARRGGRLRPGGARGWPSRSGQEGHSVSIIDKSARAFRRLPDDWAGERVVGSGFDRDDLERAGAVGADAAGRGDQRRQHQHPDRAHRPGDLLDPPGGGPHLRPAPGRHLPAPGHPHRGHRHLDHRPGPPAPAARGGRRASGPTPRAACSSSSGPSPTAGPAARSLTSTGPARSG